MIVVKNNFLTSEECNTILSAASDTGFNPAHLIASDGSNYYDSNIRGGKISFINLSTLTDSLVNKVKNAIEDYNQPYKIFFDEYTFQVTTYNEAEIGFKWHSDDSFYPITDLWRGRKITAVIELSDPSSYSGGQFEVSPDLGITPPINLVDSTTNYSSNTTTSPQPDIVYHPVQTIDQEPTSGEVPTTYSTNSNISIVPSSSNIIYSRKGQGDCIIFPSFLFHRVTPILKGSRSSLTVWCKGPRWA
jgi:hypothetical protein